jgi:hypothetical protein
MKYNRLFILIAIAGCQPDYTSGKTECSDKKECPSGFSCSDDGTSSKHYCVDNKKLLSCTSDSKFYCSQSDTCWPQPGACSTVKFCGTATVPGSAICATPGWVPDCNGKACNPPSGVGTGGNQDAGVGLGGAGSTGGIKTTLVGTGGIKTTMVGTGGSVGNKDAGGFDAIPIGGIVSSGGASGRGGAGGAGGSTVIGSLCSGTPDYCSTHTSAASCASGLGCVWDSVYLSCSGSPLPCSSYASGANCVFNGCTWAGTLTCNATPVTAFCTSMTATTTCDTCVLNSCCTQFTNCYNDSNCYNGVSGTYWDAYIACGINCCKTACGY